MKAPSHPRIRALIAAGALATALAVPLTVNADTTGGSTIPPAYSSGASISLGRVTLVSKLMSTVDVSFTCDPLTYFDWNTYSNVTTTQGYADAQAAIVQRSGKTIESATGQATAGTVICDGSTVSRLSIPVVAVQGSWKTGTVVVGAWMNVYAPDLYTFKTASTGPISTRLAK